MKTVLFVPGFQEDLNDRNYKEVLGAIEDQGYKVKFVPIQWKRTTIDDWIEQLEDEYRKHDAKDTILAGFSFGSMTAFVVAAKRLPAELWLFSFSPYFSDDIPKLKKSWKNIIGHRRVSAFARLDFPKLARSITCPTIIMLGEVESSKYPLMQNRSEVTKRMIANNQYVVVSDADHDVSHKNYIKAIKETI